MSRQQSQNEIERDFSAVSLINEHRSSCSDELKDADQVENIYTCNNVINPPTELNSATLDIDMELTFITSERFTGAKERSATSMLRSSDPTGCDAARPALMNTSTLLIMLITIDFVVEFCAWGLYWNVFTIALQYRILEKQLDMWQIYFPLVIGGITAGFIFDFKRLNRAVSRYRCDCGRHDTTLSMSLGLLSFLSCFVTLYCAPLPVIDKLGLTLIVHKSSRWFFYLAMFLFGTGIAWFFKTSQVVIKELIAKQHSSFSATDAINPPRPLWLRYFYFHFVASALSRLCGSLVAGSMLVYEPLIVDPGNYFDHASLQCGVTTQSYLIGSYFISGNDWSKRGEVTCWLTYCGQWLLLNIAFMSAALMLFLVLCFVCNFERIFPEGFASATANRGFEKSETFRRTRRDSWTGASQPTLNALTANDVIRCLYHTGDDISAIQYDIRD